MDGSVLSSTPSDPLRGRDDSNARRRAMDVHRAKLKLEVVDARIRAGERLVAEQELRIERVRTLGIDESPSMKLLQQFQLSLELLTRTRSIVRQEIEGTYGRRVGPPRAASIGGGYIGE